MANLSTTTTSPPTTTTHPATTTTHAPTTTTHPPTTTTHPATTTTRPATTTTRPATTTTAPATTTTRPATTTTRPATTTTHPATTTTAPGTTTTHPAATTTAQGTTTTHPAGTTTAPGTTTTHPAGTTTAPAGTTTAPGGTTTHPAGTTTAPGGTTTHPGSTTTGAPGPSVDSFEGKPKVDDGSGQLSDSLQVAAGAAVVLSWTVSNAPDGVELTDPAQTDPVKFDSGTSSTEVTPAAERQDYSLVAVAGDKRSDAKTVHVSTHGAGHVYSPHSKVLPPGQPPQINYFRALAKGGDVGSAGDSLTAAHGDTVTLAWEVEGDVSKLEIDNDVGDVTSKTADSGDGSGEGTADVTLPSSGDSVTYTLTVTPENANQDPETKTVTVTLAASTSTTHPGTTTTHVAATTTAPAATTTAPAATTTAPAGTTTAAPAATTTAAAPQPAPGAPTIKAFACDVTSDENGANASFTWTIAGKYGKVLLPPLKGEYGKSDFTQPKGDGTASGNLTTSPSGDPGDEVTYTLQVFDTKGKLADSRSVTKTTPKPVATSGIAFKSFKADQKKVAKDDKINFSWEIANYSHQKVELWIKPEPTDKSANGLEFTQSTGNDGKGSVPVLANTSGVGDEKKLTYQMSVYDTDGTTRIYSDPIEFEVVESSPGSEVTKSFSVPIKIPVVKGAGSFIKGEIDFVITWDVKIKVGGKEAEKSDDDLEIDVKNQLNKPKWKAEILKKTQLPDHPAHLKSWAWGGVAAGELKEDGGDAEIAAVIKLTFDDALNGATVEGELVGVEVKKEDGKYEATGPGTVKVKTKLPLVKLSNILKSEFDTDFDFFDTSLSIGVEGEIGPNYVEIGLAIGMDGLLTIGLILVAVLVIVALVELTIEMGEFKEAQMVRGRADDWFKEFWPTFEKTFPGDYEDPPMKPDPHDSISLQAMFTADQYTVDLFKSYQTQPDTLKYRQKRKNAGANDLTIDDDVKRMFDEQCKNKRDLILARARFEIWNQVRTQFYRKFREDNSSPIARNHAMGALFADGRIFEDEDCDFPDINNDAFVWGMADAWTAGGEVASSYQASLKERWTKRGYSVFPPDAADRARKHNKQWGGSIIDISTGKTTDDLSQCGPMASTMKLLSDRGMFLTGKTYNSKLEMLQDFANHGGQVHVKHVTVRLPGNDHPIETTCINDANHIALEIASSDEGVQFGLFYTMLPATAKLTD